MTTDLTDVAALLPVVGEQTSSVQIEQMAKGPRITVKSYHHDIGEAMRLAIATYRDTCRELGVSPEALA